MSFTLTLLGTGGPRPNPERSQSALVLEVGDERYLVDCGDGTTQQLLRAGFDPADFSTAFLTHLHVDHCFGLVPFVYAGWYHGRRELWVYGPSRTRALIDDLLFRAYAADIDIRVGHGRPAEGIRDVHVAEIQPGVVLETPACRITALPVIHRAPSETYALRFEDRDGHVVVLSSDTGYSEALAEFARDADLLVHECFLVSGGQFSRESGGFRQRLAEVHVTPEQAGEIGRLANARQLVLTHLPTEADETEVAQRASVTFGRPVTVGRDLMRLQV